MGRRFITWCVVLTAAVLWCAMAGQAPAQTVQEQGYRPIDQLRDDVDPLSHSLRHTDAGLDVAGERQNVYRSTDPSSSRFYYLAKGVIAEFDRSDYAFTREGGVLQLAPPNMVYHISPPKRQAAAPPVEASDQRLEGRVDGRVTQPSSSGPQEMVAFRVGPMDQMTQQAVEGRTRSTWENYHYLSTVNRMVVVGALVNDGSRDAPAR